MSMLVYAGIDEAGYGPMFGPLLIGSAAFVLEDASPDDQLPDLWGELSPAVCRGLSQRRGRVAINDSKKLHTQATGIMHLERGVLACVAAAGKQPSHVGQLLDALGENDHHALQRLPWYEASRDRPWDLLPAACTIGEAGIACSMLTRALDQANIKIARLAAAVVFEDRFNQMVAATKSKASTSFTFVARHLRSIWQAYGRACPTVVVDRQSGRTHYLSPLAINFPDAELAIVEESPHASIYHLAGRHDTSRRMTVRFETNADGNHLPVALASMISKYCRELLMHRFQNWFAHRAPAIRPTAGYARDGKRFWDQIEPMLGEWAINPNHLRRSS
ncbi:MAG: hypothetical protein QF785_02420 [Phycisphaeraceae bacterium]|jgi:hypothetical protein|nr:hypothetical protein [Phycisphaeraceae bacterium]